MSSWLATVLDRTVAIPGADVSITADAASSHEDSIPSVSIVKLSGVGPQFYARRAHQQYPVRRAAERISRQWARRDWASIRARALAEAVLRRAAAEPHLHWVRIVQRLRPVPGVRGRGRTRRE